MRHNNALHPTPRGARAPRGALARSAPVIAKR